MSACTKYNWWAFFLKQDFTKAFDMIDWSFLLKVLQVRAFGNRWCGWILSLLSSGFSSILVNGQTGALSNVNVGWGKEHPLPVFIYIWVHVLSRILKLVYDGGFVQKVGPQNPGITCLQYADDTIMLLPLNFVFIKRVKILIYIFELVSGVSSNYHKSLIYQLGPQAWIVSGLWPASL